MYDVMILTTRNIKEVAQASGKEFNYLVRLLLAYDKQHVYPVRVPLPINLCW